MINLMSYVCFSPTFSTYAQAVSHLTKGLELLKTLPETPERNQHELVMQASLGHSLMTSKGYAGAEVEQAYTRARGLCGPVGETSQIFPVLWGLWAFYVVRAELQMALELGEQLLSLAQSEQDQALLLEAHHALGVSLFWLGDMAPARAHLEQGIALYLLQAAPLPSSCAGPRGDLPIQCGPGPVAAAEQTRRSPPDAGGHIRMVH